MCRLTNSDIFRDSTRIDNTTNWDDSDVFTILDKTKVNAKTDINLTCHNFRSIYNIAILDNMSVCTRMNDRVMWYNIEYFEDWYGYGS